MAAVNVAPSRRYEGTALLVAGHLLPNEPSFDASAVHTLGQIGEVLLATGASWQIRRLSAATGERYAPDRAAITALTPATFRAFWEPRLASGPIEVQLFGDMTSVDYKKILAETLGALPARKVLEPASEPSNALIERSNQRASSAAA